MVVALNEIDTANVGEEKDDDEEEEEEETESEAIGLTSLKNCSPKIVGDGVGLNVVRLRETSDNVSSYADSTSHADPADCHEDAEVGSNPQEEELDYLNGDEESPEIAALIAKKPSAKDTRYSWLVAFLVYLVNVMVVGNFKSFGITFTIVMDYFPDAPAATAGWILGLLMGCRCLLSPVMGALTVIIGPRKCVIFGALICSASFLLALPALSIGYMALTLGGMFGIGMCMVETPGYILITDFFQEKRALANGVRAAGNPSGGVIFSPIVALLHQYFGFKGAFVIMSGIMLQLVVLGMLLRSYEQYRILVEDRYWRKELDNSPALEMQIKNMRKRQISQDKGKKKKKALDFSFFKNPPYIVYLLVVICSTAALPNAFFFLAVYGKTIGLSDLENSAVSSYCALCDAFMRISCGWIFSATSFKKTRGFLVGLLVGTAGCFMVPLCGTMWHLIIPSTLMSISMGFFWTLINVILADQFGGESMPSTWGFFRMVQGMASFLYPPLVGYVMDVSGGMAAPYFLMGGLLLLSAVIFSLQPLVAKLPGSKVINLSW